MAARSFGHILPDSMKPAIEALERFGFIILLLAMQTGIFGSSFSVPSSE